METQKAQSVQLVNNGKKKKVVLDDLTPKEIVEQLDAYIIGQNNAKKRLRSL